MENSDDLVEKFARALCVTDGADPDGPYWPRGATPGSNSHEPIPMWRRYEKQARFHITAHIVISDEY